jgi:hypothetical protein
VSIDGATIEGSVELAADTVQVVTVHHPGLDPVRVNLTLRPGEVRVLAVSPLGAEVAPR